MLERLRESYRMRTKACVAVFAVLACASYGFAQATDGSTEEQPAPCGKERGDLKQAAQLNPPKTSDNADCGTKSVRQIKLSPTPKSNFERFEPGVKKPRAEQPVPADQGPHPQWVCEAETVTVEPVWSGKQLKATWMVRNGGEGDLNIRLKGG